MYHSVFVTLGCTCRAARGGPRALLCLLHLVASNSTASSRRGASARHAPPKAKGGYRCVRTRVWCGYIYEAVQLAAVRHEAPRQSKSTRGAAHIYASSPPRHHGTPRDVCALIALCCVVLVLVCCCLVSARCVALLVATSCRVACVVYLCWLSLRRPVGPVVLSVPGPRRPPRPLGCVPSGLLLSSGAKRNVDAPEPGIEPGSRP